MYTQRLPFLQHFEFYADLLCMVFCPFFLSANSHNFILYDKYKFSNTVHFLPCLLNSVPSVIERKNIANSKQTIYTKCQKCSQPLATGFTGRHKGPFTIVLRSRHVDTGLSRLFSNHTHTHTHTGCLSLKRQSDSHLLPVSVTGSHHSVP